MPNDTKGCLHCKFLGVDQALVSDTSSPQSTLHSSTYNILSYFAWIVPAVLLLITIILFVIQYNRYERKKQLEQKKIQAQLKQQ
jgi:hypothetical protein